MRAVLDENELDVIAEKVIKRIEANYDLVPKQRNDNWVGIDEFRKALPVIKAREWVRLYLLTKPEFKDWVINVNAGKGHPTKINKAKAVVWTQAHQNEIDWNKSLPQ